MPGILEKAEADRAMEYEYELEHFYSDESFFYSEITGRVIPEPFKGLDIRQTLLPGLDFKPKQFAGSTYVKFVDDLVIDCDGKITFDLQRTHYKKEITLDQLLDQSRWRTLRLKICGRLEIPEGRKLLIYARDKSEIENLDLVINANSFLSLRLPHVEYSGAVPQVSKVFLSILKLNFNK